MKSGAIGDVDSLMKNCDILSDEFGLVKGILMIS